MTPYEELAIAIYERAKNDHIKALIKIEKYHIKQNNDPEFDGYPPFKAYKDCKEIIQFIHEDLYMNVSDVSWEKMVVKEAEKKLKKELVYARKYASFREILGES